MVRLHHAKWPIDGIYKFGCQIGCQTFGMIATSQ
jgi:hypothetical protein